MADGWDTGPGGHGTVHRSGREQGEAGKPVTTTRILAYRPTCDCDVPAMEGMLKRWREGGGCLATIEGRGAPCRALDPFAGTGTVAQVAQWLGRDSTAIELNPEYVPMIHQRLKQEPACARRKERNVTADVPPGATLFSGMQGDAR